MFAGRYMRRYLDILCVLPAEVPPLQNLSIQFFHLRRQHIEGASVFFAKFCTFLFARLPSRSLRTSVASEWWVAKLFQESNVAETCENTALCTIFSVICICVPRYNWKFSMTNFKCTPEMDDETGLASNVLLEDVDVSVRLWANVTSCSD